MTQNCFKYLTVITQTNNNTVEEFKLFLTNIYCMLGRMVVVFQSLHDLDFDYA